MSTPVHPDTLIVAELFATTIGYHVTYQDIHGQLHQVNRVRYANSSGVVTNWGYDYPIGNLSAPGGSALSAIYTTGTNIIAESETIFQVSNSQIRPLIATVHNKTNSINDIETWNSGKQHYFYWATKLTPPRRVHKHS